MNFVIPQVQLEKMKSEILVGTYYEINFDTLSIFLNCNY